MAKTELKDVETGVDAPASDVAAAPDAPVDITLDEFCIRLSKKDRRVELIGAFHFTEKAAGHVKDAESAFAERYETFVNKPV